jgi:hypothetical protein
LLTAMRSPELGRVWATAVQRTPGLARIGEENPTNTLVVFWPRKLGLEMVEWRRESFGRVGGNSDEESRPRRGGLGRAKAWTSYGRVRGTSRTEAGA